MASLNFLPYLNRILYGSYHNHDHFDLKPTVAPMTGADADSLRHNHILRSRVSDLGSRVEVSANNTHKVDQFFFVKRIEKGQFNDVKSYWQKVESNSPSAAAGFIITAIGGLGVCFFSSSRWKSIAGFVGVVASLVIAGKCISDQSISHTYKEVLKEIDKEDFQNFGEYFAWRRSTLFPTKFAKLSENRNLRLEVNPWQGILQPAEVHALYTSDFRLWSTALLQRAIDLRTPGQQERWVQNCLEGLGFFFNEEVIPDIFREDQNKQTSLLQIGKRLKELNTYIQESEEKIHQPVQELKRRAQPLLNKIRELLKALRLDAFVKVYIKKEVTDKKTGELNGLLLSEPRRKAIEEKWNKIEQEIYHYYEIALDAFIQQQWGAMLRPFFTGIYRLGHYYPQVESLLRSAENVIEGRDSSYTLDKREVTLDIPDVLDPDTLTLHVTRQTQQALLRMKPEKGNIIDYFEFLDGYFKFFQPRS